jgi:hypothetical protein
LELAEVCERKTRWRTVAPYPQVQIDRLLKGRIHIGFISASGGVWPKVSLGL